MERHFLSSVMADPIDRKIHKLSLFHHAELCIAERGYMDFLCPLKSRADFNKIFSVNIERFVLFPDALSVFHHRAVFHTIMLSGIFCTYIGEMQGCVFIVTYPYQQHITIQLVQLSDGRTIAEDIREVVTGSKVFRMFSPCGD